MAQYFLENALKLHEEYTDTFEIPSKEEIDSLKINDLVKLIFTEENDNPEIMPERMWVKITEINEDNFKGILDNDPYYLKSIKCGDEVVFKSENIIDIYWDLKKILFSIIFLFLIYNYT